MLNTPEPSDQFYNYSTKTECVICSVFGEDIEIKTVFKDQGSSCSVESCTCCNRCGKVEHAHEHYDNYCLPDVVNCAC